MSREEILKAVRALVDVKVFGVLAVETAQGEVLLRPIGGSWGSGVRDAVQEVAQKYPGCTVRLLLQNSDYERYFDGIIARDRVLPYAGYSPELKSALERLRQELGFSVRREKGPGGCC